MEASVVSKNGEQPFSGSQKKKGMKCYVTALLAGGKFHGWDSRSHDGCDSGAVKALQLAGGHSDAALHKAVISNPMQASLQALV